MTSGTLHNDLICDSFKSVIDIRMVKVKKLTASLSSPELVGMRVRPRSAASILPFQLTDEILGGSAEILP